MTSDFSCVILPYSEFWHLHRNMEIPSVLDCSLIHSNVDIIDSCVNVGAIRFGGQKM